LKSLKLIISGIDIARSKAAVAAANKARLLALAEVTNPAPAQSGL
jgi:hypothetical protein